MIFFHIRKNVNNSSLIVNIGWVQQLVISYPICQIELYVGLTLVEKNEPHFFFSEVTQT